MREKYYETLLSLWKNVFADKENVKITLTVSDSAFL